MLLLQKVGQDLLDTSLDFERKTCPLSYRPHDPSITLQPFFDNVPGDFYESRDVLLIAWTD